MLSRMVLRVIQVVACINRLVLLMLKSTDCKEKPQLLMYPRTERPSDFLFPFVTDVSRAIINTSFHGNLSFWLWWVGVKYLVGEMLGHIISVWLLLSEIAKLFFFVVILPFRIPISNM